MTTTELYEKHLATLDGQLEKALESAAKNGAGFDAVLFHAGREATYHRDDELIPFRAAAHFRRFTPLPGPEHVVLARPGEKPRIVRVQSRDFWFDTSPPPPSYWEESVDLREVESFEDVAAELGSLTRTAYVGPNPEAAAELGLAATAVEPEALMAPLDWYRAYKTEHEIALLAVAAEHSARGHHAAREAFENGDDERDIHRAYLRGAGALEAEMPYPTIVALDEKAAILHYQNKRSQNKRSQNKRTAVEGARVLLIDAGAAHDGYAADITRTWTRSKADPVFVRLVEGMDRLERDLVDMVRPGRPYLEIHLAAHRGVAELLAATGVVTASAEEALEKKITSVFLPHGVGHQLGLQVHDVGGHQAGPEGGEVKPPEDHAFLRNTRILEPGHVVTIEPGLYFIPMLLEPLRESADAGLVNWDLVERLIPHGGIRIEDNIVTTDAEPRDLTRSLIAGPRGE